MAGYVDFDDVGEWVPGLDTIWGLDEFVFTAQSDDLKHNLKAKEIVGSTFGTDTAKKRPGIQDADLQIKGNYRGGHGQLRDIIRPRIGRRSPSQAWYSFDGVDVGAPATFQPSHAMEFSRSSGINDPAKFDLTLAADGAYHDGFVMLSPNDILTGTTGSALEDDNEADGGATTTGYAALLILYHMQAGTTPTFTAKLEHSDDDGETWTPFLTFPVMNGAGARYVKLPKVTTVHSLTRASWTATGTPTGIQAMLLGARGINRRV